MDEPATWTALERHRTPDWLRDACLGLYFHWGPYAVPAFDSEWYPRNMYRSDAAAYDYHREHYGDPADVGYHEFIDDFHGDAFDPEAWADRCDRLGADVVGITAIHHDGFALWDSDLTEWNAAAMGPERDVLGELATAVRDRGMRFMAAFHHAWRWWYYPRDPDFHTTDPAYAGLYGERSSAAEETPPASYFEQWRDLTIEVMDEYRPDLCWFDFGWGNQAFAERDRYRREVVDHYFSAAEEWGIEVDIAHKRNLPVGVGILDYERSRREDLSTTPWITDTSIDRASWGYVADPDFKDPRTMIEGVIDRTSKYGATILNVGPKPDGTIPDAAADRLETVAEWLADNGEGVRGVRPWWTFGEGPTEVTSGEFEEASAVEFTDADRRFTRDDDAGYVFVFHRPPDGVVEVSTSLTRRVTGRRRGGEPIDPDDVTLLGSDAAVSWDRDAEALHIRLPDRAAVSLPCCLRLDVDDQ